TTTISCCIVADRAVVNGQLSTWNIINAARSFLWNKRAIVVNGHTRERCSTGVIDAAPSKWCVAVLNGTVVQREGTYISNTSTIASDGILTARILYRDTRDSNVRTRRDVEPTK